MSNPAELLTMFHTKKHLEAICLSLLVTFMLPSLAQVGSLFIRLSRVMLWSLTQEVQAPVSANTSYLPRLKSLRLVVWLYRFQTHRRVTEKHLVCLILPMSLLSEAAQLKFRRIQ